MSSKSLRNNLMVDFSNAVNLEHPNIVGVQSCYEDSVNFYIVSDYMGQGNLYDFLAGKKSFSEK